jgi:hypothetical protein
LQNSSSGPAASRYVDDRDLLRSGRLAGFIEPCLPSPAKAPPAGPEWIHEMKHDGFRLLARLGGKGVRLFTRNGHDFTERFPLVVAAVTALPVRSCLIDGEAIVSDDSGLAVFELIRHQRGGPQAVLCAFDLLELDGEDLRRLPIEVRKAGLIQLLHTPHPGIALNEHYVGHVARPGPRRSRRSPPAGSRSGSASALCSGIPRATGESHDAGASSIGATRSVTAAPSGFLSAGSAIRRRVDPATRAGAGSLSLGP